MVVFSLDDLHFYTVILLSSTLINYYIQIYSQKMSVFGCDCDKATYCFRILVDNLFYEQKITL